jgi:hypothetical protein
MKHRQFDLTSAEDRAYLLGRGFRWSITAASKPNLVISSHRTWNLAHQNEIIKRAWAQGLFKIVAIDICPNCGQPEGPERSC